MHRLRALSSICFLAISLSSCALLPEPLAKQWKSLREEIRGLGIVLTGGSSPFQPKKAKPGPADDLAAEAGERAKANAQILSEMFQVVTLRVPGNRSEFGSLVDTLNQGASYEGIYNGLTHSSGYRKLEQANPGARAEALDVFAEELSRFETSLAQPTEFTASAAEPLPQPMTAEDFQRPAPSGPVDENAPREIVFRKASSPVASAPPGPERRSLVEGYLSRFANSSFFTLKRILGDEALKAIAEKKAVSPAALADWYGKWANRVNSSYTVDFGLALRNRADEAFHRDWALHATQNQLVWEVLNRVHRLINTAQRPPVREKISPVSPKKPAVVSEGSAK